MAVPTENRGVMDFLVVMASEAGLACGDLPAVGCVTADTGDADVLTLPVQPGEVAVARSAIGHGLEFRFFKMACLAAHRHHRGRGVKFMTRDAVERRPITCPVAEAAEDRGVSAFQRPRMPGSRTDGRGCPEGRKCPTLRESVANGTGARKDFALLAYVAIIMTSETSGPVAVTDIVGVSRPVHLHGLEDVSFVNGKNRIDRLVNLGFLIFEDIR
jgi:hypothetical protein